MRLSSSVISFRIPKEIEEFVLKRVKELKVKGKSDYFKYLLARDLKREGYEEALKSIKIKFRGDIVE